MVDTIGSRPVAKQACRTEKKAGTATRRLARGRCSVYIVTSSQTGAGPLDCRGTRYRCFHLAEALRNAGYIAAVYPHDTFLEAPNPVFDIYAFHRPSAGDERLRTVVGALRKLQKTLVADIDRYIFREQENEDETIGQARADQVRALRLFEHVTAATTALTEHAEKHHAMAEVQVITNSILPSLLGLVESQGTNLLARPDRTIGYAHWPDSATADFSAVQDVLFKTVAEDQTARLILFGPVKPPAHLENHPRVELRPAIRPSDLPFLFAECACIVGPLEDSERGQSTSRAGYLEASLAGCKYVATPLLCKNTVLRVRKAVLE